MSDLEPEYYTVQDIMRLTSTSRATVYRWLDKGALDMVYIGSIGRITAESYRAMVARVTDKPPEPPKFSKPPRR